MKSRILYVILFLFSIGAQAQVIMPKGESVVFEKHDVIDIATYNWPKTLVSYYVAFEEGIEENLLSLMDLKQNHFVPFQLSERKIKDGLLYSAKVNFFASLPQGGYFKYELSANGPHKVEVGSPMSVVLQENSLLIGNDNLSVCIPSSQNIDSETAPAPIISICKNGRKIGNNIFNSGNKRIDRIETTVIENGNLFVTYQIKYYLSGNSIYTAQVKAIHGYPFIILEEEMNNIYKEDSTCIEMCWEKFEPRKRFGTQWDRVFDKASQWLDIDSPVYTSYSQEDPHWTGMGWVEDVSKEMIYRISPFGGNSVREQTPIMSFWEEGKNADELGIFVYDHQLWDDFQYGIWQPTPDLSIYFRYSKNKLYFKYPLLNGKRSTALAFFSVEKGNKEVESLNRRIDEIALMGGLHKSDFLSYRYTQILHQQYASLSLDRIKDWELEYPDNKKQPKNLFYNVTGLTSEEFYKSVVSSALAYYPIGLNFYPGIHSIEHRIIYSKLVEGYLMHARNLSEKQRKTVNALFIMGAYVNMLEEMNAIRTSLAGTANMAADGWCVPMQVAYLFPEHIMAEEWGDFFEKCLEIYGLFYTRPDVKSFEGKGGRWVESLGVYNWAYLRPTSHSNIAGELYDGKNRFANPYMAERGKWMVDMLTAPVYNYRNVKGAAPGYPDGWKPGSILDENFFTRQYPAHGAHGGGITVDRPSSLYELGGWLMNYDPMVAENIFWCGPLGREIEHMAKDTDWSEIYKKIHDVNNNGTNPHLKSCKYVGHGIVLRAGVNTSEEMSIHIEQVDKGPNYRWGNQAQGNSGGLYFYAQGQIFTGYENENAGDHITNNTDGVTNFGVMKNGEFRTIGMNDLTAPLYDLDIVQFAELLPSVGNDNYCWPEYKSRSIMLVGTDYFLIFDETGTNWRAAHRFSWFTGKEFDYPKITFLSKPARNDHWTSVQTPNSKGFYRDSFGSLLTLVTHKKGEVSLLHGKNKYIPFLDTKDISDFIPNKGKFCLDGVYGIKAPDSEDLVFRSGNVLMYNTAQESFNGKAGVIRRMKNGTLQLALIKGEKIAADGLCILFDNDNKTAIALTRNSDGSLFGKFKTYSETRMCLSGLVNKGSFYIDGIKRTVNIESGKAEITLLPGEHLLEYTTHDAIPLPTEIVDVEYNKNDVLVYLGKPDMVDKVRMEVSVDGGKSWNALGITRQAKYRVTKNGYVNKIHVRAVSINGQKEALFAKEYPVYITNEAPHYPEGLFLKLQDNSVTLSWGKVLGVKKYCLYRRVKGETEFEKVYEGKFNGFVDMKAVGAKKAYPLPGLLENCFRDKNGLVIYEYAVSSINGNGEGPLSPIENTDPASWRNWYPNTELKFKRQSAFCMPPYMPGNMSPAKYYPE